LVKVIETARDVSLLRLDKRRILVVSCDSAGAVGSKALDKIHVSPYIVGRYTARVALMENLAVGAEPLSISSPLAVEPTPTGKEILRGIRAEMAYAGLSPDTPLVSSTEKNFPVRQTGAGVTVIGLVQSKSLRVGRCRNGDEVLAVGLPCFGAAVLERARKEEVSDTRDVRRLVNQDFVHEILPCGSRGVLYEAEVLAKDSSLRFKPDLNLRFDLRKSAGPATVTLCAGPMQKSEQIRSALGKPVLRIGVLLS
jgi:hypothetical protein